MAFFSVAGVRLCSLSQYSASGNQREINFSVLISLKLKKMLRHVKLQKSCGFRYGGGVVSLRSRDCASVCHGG